MFKKIALSLVTIISIAGLVGFIVAPKFGLIDFLQESQYDVAHAAKNDDEQETITRHEVATPSKKDVPKSERGTLIAPVKKAPEQSNPVATYDPALDPESCENLNNCESLTAVPLGQSGNWKLVFYDDFTSKKLNTTKWSTTKEIAPPINASPYNPNSDSAYYDNENAAVVNGNLELTLLQKSSGQYTYSSGMVHNGKSYNAIYGYFEARIQIPAGENFTPSFRLLASNGDTLQAPAITAFEYNGVQSNPQFGYQWLENATTKQFGLLPYGDTATDFKQGFHTYGLLWSKSVIQVFIDGKPGPKYDNPVNITNSNHYISFALNAHKGANVETGSKMLVDYVRIWQ